MPMNNARTIDWIMAYFHQSFFHCEEWQHRVRRTHKTDLDRLRKITMRLSHSDNHFIIFNERVERPPSRDHLQEEEKITSRSRMLSF